MHLILFFTALLNFIVDMTTSSVKKSDDPRTQLLKLKAKETFLNVAMLRGKEFHSLTDEERRLMEDLEQTVLPKINENEYGIFAI